MSQDTNKKKILKLIIIFIGIAIFTLILIMAIMYIRQKFDNDKPESNTTQNSETIKKNDDHTASIRYSGHVTIDTNNNLATLFFENPVKSSKSVTLKIIVNINNENITLAKTEKILPGEKITDIKCKTDQQLEKGQYAGKFELYFYNENGEEEIVNSNIDINITVE